MNWIIELKEMYVQLTNEQLNILSYLYHWNNMEVFVAEVTAEDDKRPVCVDVCFKGLSINCPVLALLYTNTKKENYMVKKVNNENNNKNNN